VPIGATRNLVDTQLAQGLATADADLTIVVLRALVPSRLGSPLNAVQGALFELFDPLWIEDGHGLRASAISGTHDHVTQRRAIQVGDTAQTLHTQPGTGEVLANLIGDQQICPRAAPLTIERGARRERLAFGVVEGDTQPRARVEGVAGGDRRVLIRSGRGAATRVAAGADQSRNYRP
jgi:hypothetical protein